MLNGLGITKYSFIKWRGVLLHTRERICKSAILETRCLKTQARPAAQRFFSFDLCRLIQNNNETAIVLPWTPPVCNSSEETSPVASIALPVSFPEPATTVCCELLNRPESSSLEYHGTKLHDRQVVTQWSEAVTRHIIRPTKLPPSI